MVFTVSDSAVITIDENKKEKSGVWKQYSLVFLASLPFFTHGVETRELSASVHSGHFVPLPEEVPWSTTALIVAAAVSAPIYCHLVDRWGRRSGVYLVNLAQGASCIPLFLPPTDLSIIFLHILAGISSAGLFTVLPAYIREISDDSIRGITLSLTMVMTTAGYLMFLVLDLEATMFLMVGLVAAQFLGLLAMVESPSYLVKVGKIESAKSIISKLRCVQSDSPTVSKQIDCLKEESEQAKSVGKLTLWRILKNPIYRDIIKVGLMLNTTMALGGSIVFLDQDKALMQLRMNLDPRNTIVLACLAGGSIFTLGIIKFLERKYVLALGYTIIVLSMGLLAVYTQTDLTVSSLRWVPYTSLGVLVFAYGIVWGLPALVMAEMLNLEIRAKILAMLFVYTQLLKLIHVHTFQYVEEHMGIYAVLYVFASVNMFGGVYAIFIMPNVKDKSVRQIERQMKRTPLIHFSTIKA